MNNIKEEDINLVKNLYFNVETGLSNVQDIYKKLNKKVKLKDVKIILDNIENQQIYKKEDNKKNYIPIASPSGTYQIDLTFYDNLKKFNNGYGILLTIININSRKAFVYKMKNKTADTVVNIFKDFINEEKDDIKIIEADEGSEFINSKFKKLLSDNNIELFLFNKSISPNSLAYVERYNKTIRTKIDKYLKSYKTNKYIDVLDKLVNNYNNSNHRGINMKPNDVDKIEENKIHEKKLNLKLNVLKEINENIKVGDNIRILKKKKIFSKGQSTYYSKSTYEIIDKQDLKFKVKNLDNGKIKLILPFQIKVINKDEIIKNPYLNKNDKQIEKNKSDLKNVIKENKQTRQLNREGILDTKLELDKKNKIDKKLIRQGLDKSNIIK